MTQKSKANEKGFEYGLAIVTGGSSGIGNSIIEQLRKVEPAPKVFNLSRSKPTSFYNDPEVDHLECDLADPEHRKAVFADLIKRIEEEKESGPILLVNNAGFGLYGSVDDVAPERHLELIQVNIAALVELGTRLLPIIRQRGGSIMNIASTAAFQATPHMATYGASKAFVLSWTLALNEELRGSPASAIAVCPGATETNFFRQAGATAKGAVQTPDQVARAALQALRKGRSHTVTGWTNKLMIAASRMLTLSLQAWISGQIIARFRSQDS